MQTEPAEDLSTTPRAGWCQRRPVLTLLAIFIFLALPVRLYLALTATMLSRDGVTFTWYAQHLAADPLAEMKQQDQHPLYPAMILAAHETLERVGGLLRPLSVGLAAVLDDPIKSWTLAGMGVTFLGGLAAVCAVYVLTCQVFDRRAGLIAAVLAALAAEFCQLSADALTDMPHLALYLFALCAALRGLTPHTALKPDGAASRGNHAVSESERTITRGNRALSEGQRAVSEEQRAVSEEQRAVCSGGRASFPPLARGGQGGSSDEPHMPPSPTAMPAECPTNPDVGIPKLTRALPWLFLAGILSGLAYLMRPEGAGAAIAAAVVVLALRNSWRVWQRLAAALVIALAAGLVAAPYMQLTGKLVQKKSIFRFLGAEAEASNGLDQARPVAPKGRSDSCHGWSNAVPGVAEPVDSPDLPLAWPPRQGRRERTIAQLTPPLPGRASPSLGSATTSSAALHWWPLSPGPVGAADHANPLKAAGLILERWGRALRVMPMLLAIAWLFLRKRYPARTVGAWLLLTAGALHVLVLFALIRKFDYAEQFSVRHTMILAGITLPFAAAGLLAILDLLPERRRTLAGLLIVLGLTAPTTPWMFAPRNAADAHLRRAGEWIRTQLPAGAKVQTAQHPVAFYAHGTCLWSPRDGRATQVLNEARANHPDYIVIDLQRTIRACPTFQADLQAAAHPGELELADTETHEAKGRRQKALVYRYHPQP